MHKTVSYHPKSVKSPQEILESEGLIIEEAQKESFPEKYRALTSGKPISKSSKIIKLTPRLDEDGIIRCDGRLRYIEFLPFDVRFPIILPRGSQSLLLNDTMSLEITWLEPITCQLTCLSATGSYLHEKKLENGKTSAMNARNEK